MESKLLSDNFGGLVEGLKVLKVVGSYLAQLVIEWDFAVEEPAVDWMLEQALVDWELELVDVDLKLELAAVG